LKQSLPAVEERIARACERAGREPASVRIVAVTKGHNATAVSAAVGAGLRDCGENRVPELEDKIDTLGRDAAQWHLIGHLQRNKVRKALELFDVIHSIDSLRLAKELSDAAAREGVTVRGFIQVNASGEEAKGGIDVGDDVAAAVDSIREIVELPSLRIDGLMTMAPFVADEQVLRSTFSRTRRLLERCNKSIAGFIGEDLSMGMTNDFEIAVEEGSTILRLGTILFGERIK
jgi:PLP dependent protein